MRKCATCVVYAALLLYCCIARMYSTTYRIIILTCQRPVRLLRRECAKLSKMKCKRDR